LAYHKLFKANESRAFNMRDGAIDEPTSALLG